MDKYANGTKVSWRWGAHTAEGRISRQFTSDVKRTIKGTEVERHASQEEPAYMIEQDDGARVLKSHSELRRLS